MLNHERRVLRRVMKARMLALAGECAREPGSPLGERVCATMCLATFLSYIAFDGATGAWHCATPTLPKPTA